MGTAYAFIQYGAPLKKTCILVGIGRPAFHYLPAFLLNKMKFVGNNLPWHVKDSTTFNSRRNILRRGHGKFHLVLIKRSFKHRLFQTLYASLAYGYYKNTLAIVEDFLFSNGKRFLFQNFQRLEDAAFFSELTKKLIQA